MTYIRQGDLLFVPVTEIPYYETKQTPLDTRVLAQGEATGHHHQIAEADVAGAEVYNIGYSSREPNYLKVTAEGGISIVHEEHGTVTLPQGMYSIHRAREHDYLSGLSRQVRD